MYISIELGITYIWIDSLCIIQDSEEDWTYEARTMGKIYQYAACNIAAAGYDSSLGLSAEREAISQVHPALFADCVLNAQNTPGGKAYPFEGLYVRADEAAFWNNICGKNSVLSSRAWVAQERALSPGIIHMTPEMLWWECNHLVANEAFPTGGVPLMHEDNFKTCTIRSLTKESEPEDIYAFWRKFIGVYARNELTYEKDRFPAAVGIARTLSELLDDNFVAGFWERDLVRSLLIKRDARIEHVPAIQRAPSWSWASLGGAYYPFSGGPYAQPLSGVKVKVLSDLPEFKSDLDSTSLETSDVRGLEITAPLRKLPVNKEIDKYEEQWEWAVKMYIEPDIRDENDPSAIKVPEDQAWRLRDPTHVLLLAKKYRDGNERYPIAFGLSVQQVLEAEGRNTFRKLGVVEIWCYGKGKFEGYFGLHKEKGEYIPSPVFGECGFQEIVLI